MQLYNYTILRMASSLVHGFASLRSGLRVWVTINVLSFSGLEWVLLILLLGLIIMQIDSYTQVCFKIANNLNRIFL